MFFNRGVFIIEKFSYAVVDEAFRATNPLLHVSWYTAFLCKHNPVLEIAVRVKGGMSFRNGTWHGLRNHIIIQNVKYGKWRKEIN